jgi:hypothetical protein
VFTARYALSPYMKQIRFVFKVLNKTIYQHMLFNRFTNKIQAKFYFVLFYATYYLSKLDAELHLMFTYQNILEYYGLLFSRKLRKAMLHEDTRK